MMPKMILAIMLGVALNTAHAGSIYKCVSKEGKVFYIQGPCPKDNGQQKILYKETAEQATNRGYNDKVNTIIILMNQQRFDEAKSFAEGNNLHNEYNNLVNQYNAEMSSRRQLSNELLKDFDRRQMQNDIRDIKSKLDFGY